MRLQQLYIKGFKSFATETVIHFNERVTGIVGPNGSGKSNIVDAIRWVLGEQKSKELRLERMGDVLFNGTKKRKPSPVAKVNLTFVNDKALLPTEYSIVNISRVLYRSGESEYLLNDVPCRLKDVQSLFLDTGIGSDSYAIIALGMVDDILSDKENARSRMFEQAAGISKYKKRKKETLLKLKNTEEDLNRIEDLLFEIEDNLKTLERQAKRTKKYFEIKKEYRDLSIQISVVKSQQYTSQYDSLKIQILDLEDKLRKEEVLRNGEEARLEKERARLVDKEKDLSGLQKELNQLLSELRNAESDLQIKSQQLQFADQNIAQLDQQIHENQEKSGQVLKEKGWYESEQKKSSEEKDIIEKHQKELERVYQEILQDQTRAKQSLENLREQKKEADSSYAEIEKRIAVNQDRKAQLNQERERLEVRKGELELKIQETRQQLNDFSREEKSLKKELADLEKLESERVGKIQKIEQDIEKWLERLRDVQRKMDARKNERDLLKSMIDKLEGFPESIKFLDKNWKTPAPILSDLLYCDERYRPAIEWILEPYLNHYVVQSFEEAMVAISLLSSSQRGKANFILMSDLPESDTKLAMIANALPALDVIEVDNQYKKLFHYLLNSVYLVQNESWSEMANQNNPGLTLVSEGANMLRQGHILSGGSIGLFEGKKLGRKKNLEKIEKDLDELKKQRERLDEELTRLKKDQALLKEGNLEGQMKQIQNLISGREKTKVEWETRLKNWEEELQQWHLREVALADQLQKIEADDREIVLQLEEISGKKEEIEEMVDRAGGNFGSVDARLASQREELNQAKIKAIQAHNKLDQINREISFRENQIKDLQGRIDEGLRKMNELRVGKENLQKAIEEIRHILANLHQKRKMQSASLQEVETRFFEERNAIQEIEKSIRILNKGIQDSQSYLSKIKDDFGDINLKVHSISDRLEAEFNIDLTRAREEFGQIELENLEEAEDRAVKIKLRLQNFGEINPLAVEAYDTMKERFDAITLQRTDILEAKDSLIQTISEIESRATEQFMEAFNLVRDHFRNVFRELFTQDDDCDLVLLDENDPLESGIEIIAKPKGKRPKSLSQLSGGEKTLTATALLFSLYLLKPAPFCIFDEVDAPLDDANIQKFNRIIKKFSEDSQFIIITHNKLTMASVDVIYGVYMEETGVSNVSAVDFRHLEHKEMLVE